MLFPIRCKCGKLLGKIEGSYEIKCTRCKLLQEGVTTKPILPKQHTKELGE